MAEVVTRFAPSPTGFMHIGSARTALFNWLFARHHGGKYLLRIEDTDRERSTDAATAAIHDALDWFGLQPDGEAESQFANRHRHAEVAHQMLANGTAFKCFATQAEINAFREAAREEKRSTRYISPWRDTADSDHPDAPYVVRLKAPLEGETRIEDAVQGTVKWANSTLDDLVLLRSDGTPTYMLAVVVDDFDMGVTHVIRGDDHLTNAARQALIYRAMDWPLPVYAHIPLIHGPDGKKMSKRHGSVGLEEYRDQGFPARAMQNYLARLGWSHGDEEFFTLDQAISWFGLDGIGKGPARFDVKKLSNISGQHIRATDDAALTRELMEFAAAQNFKSPSAEKIEILQKFMPELKERAKTLQELLDSANFLLAERPIQPDEKAAEKLDTVSRGMLKRLTTRLQHGSWTHDALEAVLRAFAEEEEAKLGAILQPLRAALTGRTVSPSVFNVLETLGREESMARLSDVTGVTGDA